MRSLHATLPGSMQAPHALAHQHLPAAPATIANLQSHVILHRNKSPSCLISYQRPLAPGLPAHKWRSYGNGMTLQLDIVTSDGLGMYTQLPAHGRMHLKTGWTRFAVVQNMLAQRNATYAVPRGVHHHIPSRQVLHDEVQVVVVLRQTAPELTYRDNQRCSCFCKDDLLLIVYKDSLQHFDKFTRDTVTSFASLHAHPRETPGSSTLSYQPRPNHLMKQ